MSIVFFLFLFSLNLVAGSRESSAAPSSDAEAFFKGKVIKFIIPYSPGGGYDMYSRLFAPYLAKYTGARVIVRNIPGGGALIGVNTLYRSKPDGLTVGILNGTAMSLSQLTNQRGRKYDMTDLTFLGRIAAADEFVYMGAKSEFKTFDKLIAAKEKEIIWVTEGKAGSPYYRVALTAKLLKLRKGKILTGYPGSAEANLAIIRGDADGTAGTYASRQSHVDAGEFIPVLILSKERSKSFPDVPTIFEVPGLDENDRALADFLIGLDQLGRIVTAPPKMETEKVRFLRTAVLRASEDKELVSKAARYKRPINYAPHDQVEKMVQNVLEAPADVRKMIDEALKQYE
jgi:tripartite-type tricarboxylate transporter receptor subunit TctC